MAIITSLLGRIRSKSSAAAPASYSRTARPAQPRVFSYYTGSKKQLERHERGAQPKGNLLSNMQLSQRIVPVIIVVMLISIGVQLVRLDGSAVISITGKVATDTAYQIHSKDVYKTYAESQLAASWLNKTKLGLQANKITLALDKEFPEIKRASVTTELLGRRVRVRLTLRQPVLVFESLGSRYLVAGDGTVLSDDAVEVQAFADLLPRVVDEANIAVSVSERAMSAGDVSFVQTCVAQLTAKGHTVSSVSLSEQGRDLLVRLEGRGYYIRLLLEDDPSQQIGTVMAFIDKNNEQPKEYIDARVVGRVYYK